MMEMDTIECYYCQWVTDNLQECINHVAEAHREKLWKVTDAVLDDKSRAVGMK